MVPLIVFEKRSLKILYFLGYRRHNQGIFSFMPHLQYSPNHSVNNCNNNTNYWYYNPVQKHRNLLIFEYLFSVNFFIKVDFPRFPGFLYYIRFPESKRLFCKSAEVTSYSYLFSFERIKISPDFCG